MSHFPSSVSFEDRSEPQGTSVLGDHICPSCEGSCAQRVALTDPPAVEAKIGKSFLLLDCKHCNGAGRVCDDCDVCIDDCKCAGRSV